MAVLKIVFDGAESMKQWGVLPLAEKPKVSPMRFLPFRSKSKKVDEELKAENKIERPEEK